MGCWDWLYLKVIPRTEPTYERGISKKPKHKIRHSEELEATRNLLLQMINKLKKIINYLLEPSAADEEKQGREFILRVILLGMIALGAFLWVILLIDFFWLDDAYQGAPVWVPAAVVGLFVALLLLTRNGHFLISAQLFLAIFFAAVTYTQLNWRFDNPDGLLLYALIIVMASILLGSKSALMVTALMAGSLSSIHLLQANSIFVPVLSWRQEKPGMHEVIQYSSMFIVFLLVSCLYNTQIKKSLKRAKDSELALKKERDLLEVKVEERTRELKEVRMEKMEQMTRFAEVGKLASGAFHDFNNHLLDLSLYVERLKDSGNSYGENPAQALEKVSRRCETVMDFARMIRRQIRQREVIASFSLNEEITQVLQMLDFKARHADVDLIFENGETILVTGNPYKFRQLVQNLLSNAIEAYEGSVDGEIRKVVVSLNQSGDAARLTVHDWGAGIAPEDLGRVFDSFFSTKPAQKGTGLGLYICKEIVKHDFGGAITVESSHETGTVFTVELPVKDTSSHSHPSISF